MNDEETELIKAHRLAKEAHQEARKSADIIRGVARMYVVGTAFILAAVIVHALT